MGTPQDALFSFCARRCAFCGRLKVPSTRHRQFQLLGLGRLSPARRRPIAWNAQPTVAVVKMSPTKIGGTCLRVRLTQIVNLGSLALFAFAGPANSGPC